MATAEEIANKFPAFAHLVGNPEIKALLDQATGTGAGGEWSPDRFRLELQKTNWFRTTSETARKFDSLSLADPQTYEQQLQEATYQVQQIMFKEGIIAPAEQQARAFATMFLREGWDAQRMSDWLVVNHSTFDRGGGTGLVQATASKVKALAADWALPVSDEWARQRSVEINGMGGSIDGVNEILKNVAKATYQHLTPQIDAGHTIKDIAEPYVQSAAQLLELSPDAINLSDPKWSRALTHDPTGTGKPTLMGLGEWQKTVMSDAQYGWDFTNNAKTTAYDIRDKLAADDGGPVVATNSAKSIVTDFLRNFGLESLAGWAWNRYIDVGGGELGMAAFQSELPEQPEFKARFPAYDALAKKGRAMTPAEMLAYERTATQLMRNAGLPPGFYDQPEDFAKLMGSEVSVAELQQRVSIAQDWAYSTDQNTKNTLRDYYGLDEGDLTAYALNDFTPFPALQQKAVAAQLGGRAKGYGLDVTRQTAEQVAQLGISPEQTSSTLQSVADARGLLSNTVGESVAGEQNISGDEAIGGAFGTDMASRRRLKKRAGERQAAFGSSTGVGLTQDRAVSLTPVR